MCKRLSKIARCPSRKFRSLALASQCRSLSRLCVRSAARSRVWSPLPARTRLDRTLDWLLHTLAPRPPGRPESSHRCFARSFFSLFLPLDSEQWHPWRGLFVLFLCNHLAGSLHARTYAWAWQTGMQSCLPRAVGQASMLCTKNDCR